MKKSLSIFVLTLCCVFAVQAQSEPQKSPVMEKSPPPGVHDAKKRPEQTGPPPPVQTTPSAKRAEEGAKPPIETNAKPIDPSNFDNSVKPADDFFLYANG